jgi:hypothetical protein
LKEQHAQRHAITIDKLTDMGLRAYQHAMADPKGSSAAAAAVVALAKMHGLISIDRSDRTGGLTAKIFLTRFGGLGLSDSGLRGEVRA